MRITNAIFSAPFSQWIELNWIPDFLEWSMAYAPFYKLQFERGAIQIPTVFLSHVWFKDSSMWERKLVAFLCLGTQEIEREGKVFLNWREILVEFGSLHYIGGFIFPPRLHNFSDQIIPALFVICQFCPQLFKMLSVFSFTLHPTTSERDTALVLETIQRNCLSLCLTTASRYHLILLLLFVGSMFLCQF